MSTETVTPPSPNPPKKRGLDEPTWKRLLTRIDAKNCTPVIGSGACTAPPIETNPEEWGKLRYPSRADIALNSQRNMSILSKIEPTSNAWPSMSPRRAT